MSSNSISVKLRTSKNEDRNTLWNRITTTLKDNHILATKLIPYDSGFRAILSSISDADNLFQSKCMRDLKKINVEPLTTQELIAQRTIIASNVDRFVYEKNEDQLLSNLTTIGEYKIDSLFKLPRYNSLKITFDSIANTTKVLQQGLRVCNISIPATSLKRDRYVNVTFCYKCYRMDGHTAKNCDKPPDFKICSTCCDTSHTYRDCTAMAANYKCVNCGENHKTTSYACKMRKVKVAELTRGLNDKSTSAQSYANAVSNNIQSVTQRSTNTNNAKAITPASIPPLLDAEFLNDIRKDISTTLKCVVVAQLNSDSDPVSFDNTFQKLLSCNNVSKFSLGDVEPMKLVHVITIQTPDLQVKGSLQNFLANIMPAKATANNSSSATAPTSSKNSTPRAKTDVISTSKNSITTDSHDSESEETYSTPTSIRTPASNFFLNEITKSAQNNSADNTTESDSNKRNMNKQDISNTTPVTQATKEIQTTRTTRSSLKQDNKQQRSPSNKQGNKNTSKHK